MSSLVVVKKAGKAVIAADSLTTFGRTKFGQKYQRHAEKIHRFGSCYIGLVGDAAHSNVFESILENWAEDLCFDSRKSIFETYLFLHQILKEKFHLNAVAGDDMAYQSSQIDALIANQHGIFGMFEFREVHEFERFWAIGSGKPYALGAMYAVYDQLDDPEQIARIGIQASCEFDNACDAPITVHAVNLRDRSSVPVSSLAQAKATRFLPQDLPQVAQLPAGAALHAGKRESRRSRAKKE